jgi:hypothetical protein
MNQDFKIKYSIFIINILTKIQQLNKWRKDFIIKVLWLLLCIKGRVNFLQLERFGNYSEQRYRQQFETEFDFLGFNKELVFSHGSGKYAIAFDPSYISKSGKSTYGLVSPGKPNGGWKFQVLQLLTLVIIRLFI